MTLDSGVGRASCHAGDGSAMRQLAHGSVVFSHSELGCTWVHLVELGLVSCIWLNLVALGCIWLRLVALVCALLHLVPLCYTWLHLVALGCYVGAMWLLCGCFMVAK